MESIFLRIDIVLQEYFGLVVHLVVNVFAEEAANKTNTSEGQRREGG